MTPVAEVEGRTEMAEEVKNEKMAASRRRKNRIHVSSSKRPLHFYINLAKRIMQQQNEVVLSAIGMAIGTVVTIAEILKNTGLAEEKSILTSTVDAKDATRGRQIQKAKIEILLGKSENFHDLINTGKHDQLKPTGKEGQEER